MTISVETYGILLTLRYNKPWS